MRASLEATDGQRTIRERTAGGWSKAILMVAIGITAGSGLVSVAAAAGPSERDLLSEPVQLTFASDFSKAGESYFSPDGQWVIFQGVPKPAEGSTPDEHYSMYVAKIERDTEGRATGLGKSWQISADGSANTCGWFHPSDPSMVLFATTSVPPKGEDTPGYQRGSGRYKWAFPSEMDIVEARVPAIVMENLTRQMEEDGQRRAVDMRPLVRTKVIERDGYDAECSWSPDGRFLLYANVDNAKSAAQGRPDADLWVRDLETNEDTLIVEAPGYDGGPFFSPDGKWICYRSDRRGDNLLQLFVAKLAFDKAGAITGVEREIALTDNKHVNWAPYWHPTEPYLLYTTSEVGHHNYELFAIELDAKMRAFGDPVRVTHADGFDGLGVFNSDGSEMMWTSQRGQDASSQLWIAATRSSPLDSDDLRGLE